MAEKVIMKYKDYVISATITSSNIHIKDSYKIIDPTIMSKILEKIIAKAAEYDITYKRSINSWVHEWKAHNWLYQRKIKEENTKSVDLNEDETKLRLLGYWFISNFLC